MYKIAGVTLEKKHKEGIIKVGKQRDEGINLQMSKNGIILEGGAMRSVFAAGVLDFFMEEGIEIPNILAVSAGAYAGMNYVSGQKGRTVESLIKPLKQEKYLGLSTFFRKGTFFDMDYLFETVPKFLAPFDFEAFKNSAKKFLINTIDCTTGKSVFYEDFESEEKFWTLCRAANSMPFISKITKIDGIPMLDGGMSDAIPIAKAMDEGWEKIIIVLTRKADYRKKDRHLYLFFLRLLYGRYPELVKTVGGRAQRYNRCLDKIQRLEKEGKALVLRPTKMAITNQESDVDTLMEYYYHGYEEAKNRRMEIKNFLYA